MVHPSGHRSAVWPACQGGRSTWDVHLCLHCNLISADQWLNMGLHWDSTMVSQEQHYLTSNILSSKALCQQCYWKRTSLILRHISIPQQFQRWLLGWIWGEVLLVRHWCSTMMTMEVNEVSETSSKTKSIRCLLSTYHRIDAFCISCFKLTWWRMKASKCSYFWRAGKCLSPPAINSVSWSLAPSHHINTLKEKIYFCPAHLVCSITPRPRLL